MKIYQINVVCGNGSTGRIVADLWQSIVREGGECRIAYGRGKCSIEQIDCINISPKHDIYIHAFLTRITDFHGLFSKKATRKLIQDIKNYAPDLIHLHNLHGYYLNYEMLFHFLQEYNKPVVWTLHDCWAFTGHCAYFERAQCNKWLTGCEKCPAKHDYPSSTFIDNSKKNYTRKKKLFRTLDNLILITPSDWLKKIVAHSFLKEKKCMVIHNGIDMNKFFYQDNTFRQQNGIEKSAKIILGVASEWTPRKGLLDFLQIRTRLEAKYIIVLVGLSAKSIRSMPEGIIGIKKSDNIKRLAEIYSAADVFINPTYEDNFPTVNIEAMACGTPVITYDTGGSGECISSTIGCIIPKGDINILIEAIKSITSHEKNITECRRHALHFSKDVCYSQYINLYSKILK